MQLKFRLLENLDLTDWNFGDTKIDKAITEEIQDRLNVVFSDEGIEIWACPTIINGELYIKIEMIFEDCGDASAEATAKLSDLIWGMLDMGQSSFALKKLANEMEEMQSAIRKLADEIYQWEQAPDSDMTA